MENDPAATRRDQTVQLWHVADRLDLWRRFRGLPPRDADALLARVLRRALQLGSPWFLVADPSTMFGDLGPEAWTPIADGTWRVPASLNAEAFLQSEVHTIGSYLLYSSPAPIPIERLATLNVWDRPDAAVFRALAAAGIEAAIAVHADASDWMLALPTSSAGQAPQN
jgi:hypothetical protein